MNEYFQWRLMMEQTQMVVGALVILFFFGVLALASFYEKFRELRRKHWRLLIRTSRYPDSYQEWIPYGDNPGHRVLLKWRTSSESLTGGDWVFYKNYREATRFDKLRADANV